MTREPMDFTRQDRIYCLKASSEYHSELCEECKFYPNCDHMTQDDMIELTIKDLEALEKAPRWIPVDERLPFMDVDVLVDDGVDLFVAWHNGSDWYSFDDNYRKDTPILAWRSLPEPYYEESEESNE